MKTKHILITISLFILGMVNTLACNCNESVSIEESFNYSDAVFHGEVIRTSFVTFAETIKTEIVDSIRNSLEKSKVELFDSQLILKIELEVEKCFKGNLTLDTVVVYTTRTSASCGYRGFEIGKNYIVYGSFKSYAFWPLLKNSNENAIEKSNTYWTNHCTRTDVYNFSEAKELEKLME